MTKILKQKESVTKHTNSDFFNLFFMSSKTTKTIGFFGQFISAVTEFNFIFSGMGGVYNPFLQVSNILPVVFSLFVVYILEVVGVRVYLVRIVRQIANKQFKIRESYILFIFNLLFALTLCVTNLIFSYVGQKSTFAKKINVTTTDKTYSLEQQKLADINEQTKNYNDQISKRTNIYNNEVNKITDRYNSDISELKKNQKKFADLKWKYNDYTLKIDKKIEARENELKALKSDFENRKSEITDSFNDYILTLKNSYNNRINDISKTEKSDLMLWKTVQEYTMIILILFILISWVAIIYTEIFYRGAGQKIEVKEVTKRPILLFTLVSGLYDKFYHFLYKNVVRWIGLNKYKYTNIRIYKKQINPKDFLTESLESVPAVFNNTNTNSFRQIGFKTNKDINNSNINNINNSTENTKKINDNDYRITKVVSKNLRICKNCNTEYIYRHHKQKYCSENCRINFWEKKTGKKLRKKATKH